MLALEYKIKAKSSQYKAIDEAIRTVQFVRQRDEHALKLARKVCKSNDLVAYVSEAGRSPNLQVRNLVKNHCLAKSINDAAWYQFRLWIDHFAKKFGKQSVAVEPHYTSQQCSSCGQIVKKSLSTRTHACSCETVLNRDHNAALNILSKGLEQIGWGTAKLTLQESIPLLVQEQSCISKC